jgi:hypothetical protein
MPPRISSSCGISASPDEKAMSLPFQRAASLSRSYDELPETHHGVGRTAG